MKKYIFFVPLSNWLLGYDKYSNTWSKKNIPRTTYPKLYFMYELGGDTTVGYNKVRNYIERTGIKGDEVVTIITEADEMNVFPNDITNTRNGVYIKGVDSIQILEAFTNTQSFNINIKLEDITALAYKLKEPNSWQECVPRTFSVLPIAKACQASCKFCFSKSSVSDVIEMDSTLNLFNVATMSGRAKLLGAERAVITGGGEPMLYKHDKMLELIGILGTHYKKVQLITNGLMLKGSNYAISKKLVEYKENGLTTLAISRHHWFREHNSNIFGGESCDLERIAACNRDVDGPKLRLICVLQKGGVCTPKDIDMYLFMASQYGIKEVCFKELYISSGLESTWTNKKEQDFCKENQVPLSMVKKHFGGKQPVSALPWGAPVYDVNGISVALYTEPSVGWELTNKIVRSWNYMADNTCLASLETKDSLIK